MNRLELKTILLFWLLSSNVYSLTCADLDGAYVYAYDNTYLGFFGSSLSPESIMNSYGIYGSNYGTNMRNEYSLYGSPFGIYSANNSYSLNPPTIFKRGVAIGAVTNNSFITNGFSLSLIDQGCVFSSISKSMIPYPPDSIYASKGIFTDSILVSWPKTRSSNLSGYKLYFSNSSNGPWTIFATPSSDQTSYTTSAVPGRNYYIGVSAYNYYGESLLRYGMGYASASSNDESQAPEDSDEHEAIDPVPSTNSINRSLPLSTLFEALNYDDN